MSTPGSLIDGLPTGPAVTGQETIPGMVGGAAYRWTPTQLGQAPIQIVSKSTDYTFGAGDGGKVFLHPATDTTPRIWTIPANAAVAYPVGTVLTFRNQNTSGAITIAINTDTMRLVGDGTAGSRLLAANGMATAIKETPTEWAINGTGLT